MFSKLRGVDKWPTTTATVTGTETVSEGGRGGRTMNIYFSYQGGSSFESGKFFVDDNSALYGLREGDTFSVQFHPRKPTDYYCSEAGSLSQMVRRGILFVGIAFAVMVFLIEFLGNFKQ